MAEHPDHLHNIRHSLAHVLAIAVLERYPDAKLAIGPATETGFYYDFEFPSDAPGADDLPALTERMRTIVQEGVGFEKAEATAAKAREQFNEQSYKREMLDELEQQGETITLYTTKHGSGTFVDLCRGGHVESTNEIDPNAFTLDRVAGAYWRGDERNTMLTRIYGLAFETPAELEQFQQHQAEAAARDHRKLGRDLDLFTTSELVGSGLPLYTPKGTVLREQLAQFSEELQAEYGFQKVWIPHITKIDLYKTSGHWDKFGDDLMLVQSQETSDEMALKPMNCPHHTQIYAAHGRSYRELPVRYMETTTNYRDEKTGELGGLTRVRSLTQDDGHSFCTMAQVDTEVANILEMIRRMYSTLGLDFHLRLSLRDPEHPDDYLGDDADWQRIEERMRESVEHQGISYTATAGEAAFYGPKIDVMVTDALNREWQCATVQIDFVQPERFSLEYTDEHGTKQTPVMIHKALLGTIDRFLGVYIEHTAGRFPTWLAPVQMKILPVSSEQNDYAEQVATQLREAGIRIELDESGDTLGKKIRRAKTEKVPYIAVLGGQEAQDGTVTLEHRDSGSKETLQTDEAASRLQEEIAERR